MSTIKWETADQMMNVLAFAYAVSAAGANIPVDANEAIEFAQEMWSWRASRRSFHTPIAITF